LPDAGSIPAISTKFYFGLFCFKKGQNKTLQIAEAGIELVGSEARPSRNSGGEVDAERSAAIWGMAAANPGRASGAEATRARLFPPSPQFKVRSTKCEVRIKTLNF